LLLLFSAACHRCSSLQGSRFTNIFSGLVPVGVDAGGSGLRVGFLGDWCTGIENRRGVLGSSVALGSRIHGTCPRDEFLFETGFEGSVVAAGSGVRVGFGGSAS
jgi:hypothetical protein